MVSALLPRVSVGRIPRRQRFADVPVRRLQRRYRDGWVDVGFSSRRKPRLPENAEAGARIRVEPDPWKHRGRILPLPTGVEVRRWSGATSASGVGSWSKQAADK